MGARFQDCLIRRGSGPGYNPDSDAHDRRLDGEFGGLVTPCTTLEIAFAPYTLQGFGCENTWGNRKTKGSERTIPVGDVVELRMRDCLARLL